MNYIKVSKFLKTSGNYRMLSLLKSNTMNATMIQFFHWYSDGNQFYSHVEEQIEFLKELGITAIWLPPAYKCNAGGYSVGYDPYDLFDLGEFDQKGSIPTKYGTKEEYLSCTKKIQENSRVGLYATIFLFASSQKGFSLLSLTRFLFKVSSCKL